ncbi:MAG: hypothetical protein P4L71_20080 [Acetobacteraceae bacterium]|nr:hypothetical protein [Acetobacteraceae bacterium]
MATQDFTIGRSTRVVVVHALAGGVLDIGNVTGFNPSQKTKEATVDRLDGVVLTKHLPGGWAGTIECDRRDQTVDEFIAAIETAYRNNVSIPFGQMYEYINEVDGSRTTWLYENVNFYLSNAGNRQADNVIKMTLGWTASWRTQQV